MASSPTSPRANLQGHHGGVRQGRRHLRQAAMVERGGADPSLAIPVLAAYLQSNPDIKAITVPGHGGITAMLPKIMEGAGKAPGSVITGGFDISSAAMTGCQRLHQRGGRPAALPAGLHASRRGGPAEAIRISGLMLNTGGGVITKDKSRRSPPSSSRASASRRSGSDREARLAEAHHHAEDFLVRMNNIDKQYGKVVGLNNVSLDIGKNEIVGLVGDNGAGKSTLIKVLTGVETPTAGGLFIKGRSRVRPDIPSAGRTTGRSRPSTRTARSARSSRSGGISSSGGRSRTASASST